MRDRERLVQVDMADIGPIVTRPREADLSVQIRTVQIDQAAVLVHDPAGIRDALLEDAVRRRVRDHERGEVGRVLRSFRLQILQVDLALSGALHNDDLHPRHDGARRVRAVRRRRDQAHVPVMITTILVIRADHEEAGVLALRARRRRESADLSEPLLEL